MNHESTTPDSNGVALDPSAMRIASVYAKSFLGAAEAAGQTDALVEELNSLVVDVLDRLPQLNDMFASAMVSPADHERLIDKSLGGRASPVLINFLKVLAQRGRLGILRDIRIAVRSQYDEMRGLVRVQVRTASPIDEHMAARIRQTIQAVTGGQPVLEHETDPALIGGVVLRVGDTVYDASVSAQLEQMRMHMINRSIHEIQSRRDRFGYSEGN